MDQRVCFCRSFKVLNLSCLGMDDLFGILENSGGWRLSLASDVQQWNTTVGRLWLPAVTLYFIKAMNVDDCIKMLYWEQYGRGLSLSSSRSYFCFQFCLQPWDFPVVSDLNKNLAQSCLVFFLKKTSLIQVLSFIGAKNMSAGWQIGVNISDLHISSG